MAADPRVLRVEGASAPSVLNALHVAEGVGAGMTPPGPV